jgi:hypothetical protein
MKYFFISIFFLPGLALASPNFSCDKTANFYNETLQKMRPVEDSISQLNLGSRDLVLLGELHWNYADDQLKNIVEKVNSFWSAEVKKCLFIEYPNSSGFAGDDDQIFAGNVLEHPFIQIGLDNNPKRMATPQSAVAYINAYKSLDNFGYSFINVDNFSLPNQTGLVSEHIEKRNHYIASSIQTHYESGRCEKGILIVGHFHLDAARVNSLSEIEPLGIQHLLKGLNNLSINIQATRARHKFRSSDKDQFDGVFAPTCSQLSEGVFSLFKGNLVDNNHATPVVKASVGDAISFWNLTDYTWFLD